MESIFFFAIFCAVVAWWAKQMFQLLLEQMRKKESAKESAHTEPSVEGIMVEELTVDEDIVLATAEEPEEVVTPVTAPSMIGPRPVERFVAASATPADQARASKARRERTARRPGDFVSRGRVGRFITVTYEVAGELATRCWDTENLDAFWLPGSPQEDPALAGFLEGRKALPPAV